jgi:hypothetical protein
MSAPFYTIDRSFVHTPVRNNDSPVDNVGDASLVSLDPQRTPRSLRGQERQSEPGASSSEPALSGALGDKPDKAVSHPRVTRSIITALDATSGDRMTVADPSPLAKILQLRRSAEPPWVGDDLSPDDIRQTLHALTSMALAFAKYADFSGDRLVALLTMAMDAQKGMPVSEGIDEGTLAILEAIGYHW